MEVLRQHCPPASLDGIEGDLIGVAKCVALGHKRLTVCSKKAWQSYAHSLSRSSEPVI